MAYRSGLNACAASATAATLGLIAYFLRQTTSVPPAAAKGPTAVQLTDKPSTAPGPKASTTAPEDVLYEPRGCHTPCVWQ